ncbi:MAG: hypothetical protein C5B59_16230 [Bacteroidetes bacterium]|nr:MAG: hypothetical protein C5B59_16230 [Bacteroidota bacterium]
MVVLHRRLFPAFMILAVVVAGAIACHGSESKSSEKKTSDSSDLINKMDAKKTSKQNKESRRKGKSSVSNPQYGSNKMVKDKEGVYNKTDKMPEFPGGQRALANYIENNLEYPQEAIDDNRQGTVRVTFVVDEKGKVSDPKLIENKKIGDGVDEEALRVVSRMPDWKPGQVRGKNVKARLELPITFQLSS